MEKKKKCNIDCSNCKNLNYMTDDKGYVYGYYCMRYNDTVFREEFKSTKTFGG